jgi:hypothetical protein
VYTKPSTAASTAAQLNPAAASTDGLARRSRCEPDPIAARAGGPADGPVGDPGDDAADGCCGPTSVPTGVTLPSVAKPQLSSFFAESISVSAGQCSSVTMSVTPCRVAIPT